MDIESGDTVRCSTAVVKLPPTYRNTATTTTTTVFVRPPLFITVLLFSCMHVMMTHMVDVEPRRRGGLLTKCYVNHCCSGVKIHSSC